MPASVPFVHLHFHTGYSLLDGACRISEVMKKGRKQGISATAITDHGVLYGAVEFYQKAREAGIKPILGCEVYVAHGAMTERKTGPGGSQSNHLVLLARDMTGFQNLQYMVSKAHLEGFYYKPRIDKELLAAHSEGLIGLSACLKGEVTEALRQGDEHRAAQAAGAFSDILGPDNFYIEMQDHGIADQKQTNPLLRRLARNLDLPTVMTNDVHFLNREDAEAHDCMICLQTAALMSDTNRMVYGSDQFYMKTGAEMQALFPDDPQALANTVLIADRCNVELDLSGKLHFPRFDVPTGYTNEQYLWKVGAEGIHRRYDIADMENPANPDEKKVVDRFKYELDIIRKTGFTDYFLIVWDFIRYAREQHIPVGPGRGSGAGSILAYALGITNIDPLQFGLIFERFLNPERVSPPDFDIDFCQYRRGEVIEYVKQKYGRDSVAQIITFGTLGAKTVIRDVGRVLEVSFADCDRLAKMIPEDPSMTLEKAIKANPEFKEATEKDPTAKRIMKYAAVLEGLPRQPGTHAAGVVIGPRPLAEMIPLGKDKNDEPVTQYEMKPLEQTGMLKMDFLGLKTLTVIEETLRNIHDRHGVDLDLDTLDFTDSGTYDLLNAGDTIGVFQVESKGMRDLLRRIQLSRFEDLIAMIALYRPGPMNMLDDFIDRKLGKVQTQYDHPLLEDILEETYGVMLYQEQVQQAANKLAGFSLGEGDILRRAMGKKIPEVMEEQRGKFVTGCRETNHIPEEQAEKIFDDIKQFAGYGFNKSHSAAYAVLSYQTAYLKANYPSEFMAALMSNEIGNAEKLLFFITETRNMGIDVLPPSVNQSDTRFRPVDEGIRFGMAGIKNVGVGAVDKIVESRAADGPYTGFMNFCTRMDTQSCNRKTLESLIKCGAFDFTGMSRGQLFENIDFALSRAAGSQRDRDAGQGSLFDMLGTPDENTEAELADYPPWPQATMLAYEKELLGFYISGHPLEAFRWTLDTFAPIGPSRIEEIPADKTVVRMGGLVTQFQKRFTRRTQEQMGTFRLEHLEGGIEIVVFPDAFRDCGGILEENCPVLVTGELDRDDGNKIKAGEVILLDQAPARYTRQVAIAITPDEADVDRLRAIRDVLESYPGTVPVVIHLEYDDGSRVVLTTEGACKVKPSPGLAAALTGLVGRDGLKIQVKKDAPRQNRQRRFNNTRQPAAT